MRRAQDASVLALHLSLTSSRSKLSGTISSSGVCSTMPSFHSFHGVHKKSCYSYKQLWSTWRRSFRSWKTNSRYYVATQLQCVAPTHGFGHHCSMEKEMQRHYIAVHSWQCWESSENAGIEKCTLGRNAWPVRGYELYMVVIAMLVRAGAVSVKRWIKSRALPAVMENKLASSFGKQAIQSSGEDTTMLTKTFSCLELHRCDWFCA